MKRLANLRAVLRLGDQPLDEALPGLIAQARLTRLQRTALARYLAGQHVAEIARTLDTTPASVKAHIRRAVDKLRAQLPPPRRRTPGRLEHQAELHTAWRAVSNNPAITARALAAQLRIDPQAARRRLLALARQGYIERVPGRHAWRVLIPYQALV